MHNGKFGKYLPHILLTPLVLVLVVLLVRTSWVSDDAYITFRVVENFTSGYGPVFNIGERVQAFTHPLWLLLVSAPYAVLQRFGALNPWSLLYDVTMILSIALTTVAVCLLVFGVRRSVWAAVIGISVLTFSKSFIDYGTSGLENPLSYLVAALFLLVYLKGPESGWLRIFLLSLLAALGAVTRIDLLLLFTPALLVEIWRSQNRWKALLVTAMGMLPLVLWELFSIYYYGTPFPNTAYAKLNTGIDQLSLLRQGLYYYLDSFRVDPLTLLSILGISIWTIWTRQKKTYPILAGIFLYLLYILYIGGDFMSGRFFSVALLTAVGLLVYAEIIQPRWATTVLVAILAVGLIPPNSPVRSPLVFEGDFRDYISENGISDERAIYYYRTGWLAPNREKDVPGSIFAGKKWVLEEEGEVRVKIVGPLGLAGYQAGPNVHIIDHNALSDPLLSRLPVRDTEQWRIGHFQREIPDGYKETLLTGSNQIVDEDLSAYYERLVLVTRGPLFNIERFEVIWGLNTGRLP